MTGTLLNIAAILVGSFIGILIGNRLTERLQQSVMTGVGLTVFVVGVQNGLRSGNILVPLISMISGVVIGEILDIDGAVKRLGGWLQKKAAGAEKVTHSAESTPESATTSANNRARFINGFVSASVLFCVGPLAILGPIQNGINSADIQSLAIKSALDFFGSVAFSATLGLGVAFSVIPTFVIQGGFALVGILLGGVLVAGSGGALDPNNPYIRELTATGGIIMLGIALMLLDIKQPRISNYLPALVIAPLIVLVLTLLHIPVYPSIP